MKSDIVYFNQDKISELNRILDSMNIKTDNISLREDPFFDIYDVFLSSGIRSSKVEKSLRDIGLSLRAHAIPKGYPILNMGCYRIEVQVREIQSATIDQFGDHIGRTNFAIPVPVGISSSGQALIIDLLSLPNLLIAGAPGSGKSVFLHNIILSLLRGNTDLYLIDPKMVEFNIYQDHVKYLGFTVENLLEITQHLVDTMEFRFKKLAKSRCRDIVEYNSINNSKIRPIVLIVDEWADIVLQNKDVQKILCLVAQKGRAAGISIVLSTQRPDKEVISGLIKSNFSGRIAFKVNSALNSRIVLDSAGAEKITDVGTGLYQDQRMSEPTLFRAPWIKNPSEILSSIKTSHNKKTLWQKFRDIL